MKFAKREWTQQGVKYTVKEIPNLKQSGGLAPEILAVLQNADQDIPDSSFCAENDQEENIFQREFGVMRGGYEIMVTEYCREEVRETEKPAVLYFHGGGWRWGARSDVEKPLRFLAEISGVKIFNAEYRLAPEYRYPYATDDCWQVLKYLYTNAEKFRIQKDRITIAGDSAGGNLAAACSRRDRNMRTKMVYQQVLIYPALSLVEPEGNDYHFSLDDYEFDDSQAEWIVPCIQALYKSITGMLLYTESYADSALPDASPLQDRSFAGLPKTHLICAEYDYLTQQGKTYARRLAKAGIDVEILIYRGTNHGFMNRIDVCPQAEDLLREFASMLLGIENRGEV